jgi:ribose 5-phosphate isomerase B
MIYIATDHAGFELKEKLKKYIGGELGQKVQDMGAFEMNPDDDYPDFIILAAKEVALRQAQGEYDTYGIVLGASGQGEALAANKVKGIRAAVYYGGPMELVERSRSHNNANVLSLGARYVAEEEAKQAVKLWLETDFEGGRHSRRIDKISKFEKEQ